MKDSLTYDEIPIEILDRQVRRLRNQKLSSVEVLLRSLSVERATWEAELNSHDGKVSSPFSF
ncbi:hypothetical protein MTR67_047952 [Solanum verrucosum]|uniref:Uncharacterized protein n=1 Tax=Solanum verrucosum TaxID=315347 RepID=A0AAF0UY06_SOLVR|nr:hypothetical protein MTR67_047952 [Solanum verrucosum]